MTDTAIHPQLGLNPRRCVCGACGKETDHIRNLGANNHVLTCAQCGLLNYGADRRSQCNRCRGSLDNAKRRILEEGEKISGPLCDACQTQAAISEQLVASGGVYFGCKACGFTGVAAVGSPLATRIRNVTGIAAPEPVQTMVDSCPHCPASANS